MINFLITYKSNFSLTNISKLLGEGGGMEPNYSEDIFPRKSTPLLGFVFQSWHQDHAAICGVAKSVANRFQHFMYRNRPTRDLNARLPAQKGTRYIRTV